MLPRSRMLAVLAAAMTQHALAAEPPFFPPDTPAKPVVETISGVTLTDRYRWLEDGKEASVVGWTRAQHAATVAYLDRSAPPVPGLTRNPSIAPTRKRTACPGGMPAALWPVSSHAPRSAGTSGAWNGSLTSSW